MNDVFLNRVPARWMALSFDTTRGLSSWCESLGARLAQLNAWKDEPQKIPVVTWINRLKNPQSFLTAIKQVYARKNVKELNKLYIQTDILKKWYWEIDAKDGGAKEGAYVFGMQVEGARWDFSAGNLEESEPKKQYSLIPVVNLRAQELSKLKSDDKSIYSCPIYITPLRGKSYVTHAYLKTKVSPDKWILAGVSIVLDVEGFSDPYKPGFNPNAPIEAK